MGDNDHTDPQEMAFDRASDPASGEAPLPDEHTARVRARQSEPVPTVHKVHDQTQAQASAHQSSTELAEPSRRERRRARDKRAEKRAIQVLLLVFVGLGGLGLVGVNMLIEDDVTPIPEVVDDPDSTDDPPVAAPPPRRPPGVFSTTPTEEVDVPALRQLRTEGLTIACEGLPEVLTEDTGSAVPTMAALETCRFAYGVWEFSPNRRFRFMTTCEALKGQTLVGAYEVRGGKVHMSPLVTKLARIVSVFDVERPSKMVTTVDSLLKGQVMMTFTVNQRVTVMRAGMEGDGFFGNYAPKNTVGLPELLGPDRLPQQLKNAPPSKTAPRKAPTGQGDPLLDLLKGSN